MGLLHRKPPGGVLQKKWVADWRVLPNFENWMNYFRNNESNLKANDFYDIDYEKLATISEGNRVLYPNDNSMIVVERRTIGGKTDTSIRVTKNKLEMGIDSRGKAFWYFNDGIRLTIEEEDGKLKSLLTLPSGLIIVMEENGEVYQKIGEQPGHLTMPSGHRIVFNKTTQLEVLHPNGGLTYPPFKYTTKMGYGKEKGQSTNVPTLQRTTETHNVIKRDDDTVIVHNGQKEWITFHDGTEMEINENGIVVEYGDLARWSSTSNGFKLSIDDLSVVAIKISEGKYAYHVGFSNDSEVIVKEGSIYCLDGAEKARLNLTGQTFGPRIKDISAVYQCNLNDKILSTENGNIKVHCNGIIEQTNGQHITTIDDADLNEEELKNQPISPTFIEPRLFIIYPDNTGVELLSEKQVADYRREIKKFASNSVTLQPDKFYTFTT